MRKPAILPAVAAMVATFSCSLSLSAQTNNWSLTLEVATQGLTNWQAIPVTAGTIRNGKINLSTAFSSAFWRVRIAPETTTMIAVQGGTLPTNSSRAAPINVPSFRIGKYEVTIDEWLDVIAWAATNGYVFANGPTGSAPGHPVRNLNWYNAVKWCNAKSQKEGLSPVYEVGGAHFKAGETDPQVNRTANGYRLPTEAEWEWAARGGMLSQGFVYAGGDILDLVAWNRLNSFGAVVDIIEGRGTWPVGQKVPNELGIYDMSGNVWEWCEDSPGPAQRLLRGSSWDNSGSHQLDASGRPEPTINEDWHFGFRLARNPGP